MKARSCKLVVEFGKSSSQGYSSAVSLAKRMKKYSNRAVGNVDCHTVDVVIDDYDDVQKAVKLIRIMSGWKSSRVYLNDDVASGWQAAQYLECFAQKLRQRDSVKDKYCLPDVKGLRINDGTTFSNGRRMRVDTFRLPCKQMYQYGYGSNGKDIEWWKYGSFQNGKWLIDADAISEQVALAFSESPCGWCPGFSPELVKTEISKLPSAIDPQSDTAWQTVEHGGKITGIFPALPSDDADDADSSGFSLFGRDKNEWKPAHVSADVLQSVDGFDKIGGLDSEIGLLRELLEAPLLFPALYDKLGIRPKKSVLMAGPPGCGKTMLARALAKEIKATFFAVSTTELKDKYVGETERKIRLLFENASQKAPAIVFMDEFDAIAYNRNLAQHEWEVSPLEQLLAIIDGFHALRGVGLICATNRPACLDPAITRPGRLDYIIRIPIPNIHGRTDILNIHSASMPLAKRDIITDIAKLCEGYTGADLRGLVEEAGMCAARRTFGAYATWKDTLTPKALGSLAVTLDDFRAAVSRIKPTEWHDETHSREICLGIAGNND